MGGLGSKDKGNLARSTSSRISIRQDKPKNYWPYHKRISLLNELRDFVIRDQLYKVPKRLKELCKEFSILEEDRLIQQETTRQLNDYCNNLMMKYSEFKEEAEANDYPEESTPLFIVDERSVKSVLQLDRIFKEGTKTNARKKANEKYDFVSRPRAYTDKKDNWPKEFDFICRGLMSHLGPPLHKDTLVQLPPFNSTDLVSLSIMAWPGAGIDLFRKTRQVIHIADLVRNNTGLETIELGFTGLSDVGLTQIIDPLSTLPKLTFLDLKGNRLTQQAVDMFTQMLKDEAKFPSILWIDLRNNIDILTLPNIYLDAISKRWPKPNDTDEQTVQLPTHRELAEGQVIVKDGQFETVT